MTGMSATAVIRSEMQRDAAGIRSVLEAAFGGSAEADLTERLRADGDLVLALVAELPEGLAGYVAFPRLTLASDGRSIPALGLAPVGVLPARQRQGVGSALIRAGLARLKDRGEGLVFVLGEPDYYSRFGFEATPDFVSTYAGPYFQTLRLSPNAPVSGTVTYPPAFATLG
jgi:putative acetyltransferase